MKEFLDRACEAYYEGAPFMTDEEFDLLAEKHQYNAVGYKVTDAIPHTYRMYSLKKCFDLDDAPLNIKCCIETPKLDGAAVSLLYVEGLLQLALTRGDGIQGRDITNKMRLLVPEVISVKAMVQITGEVVAPSSVPNSRNFASGSLGLNDLEEFATRPLAFVAYGQEKVVNRNFDATLEGLERMGFNTALSFDCTDYPTDGIVYRLRDNFEFENIGHTSNHPRGAFALKEQKMGEITTLIDVVWQLGKSGVVSPVGILDPIEIGGATVSRATLHNIEYIRDLNLEIGCQVEVIRSGEIIPRIVRRVEPS
ncbi:DNA ligase [bacterium]|nr:DNA ligase [bacterium]